MKFRSIVYIFVLVAALAPSLSFGQRRRLTAAQRNLENEGKNLARQAFPTNVTLNELMNLYNQRRAKLQQKINRLKGFPSAQARVTQAMNTTLLDTYNRAHNVITAVAQAAPAPRAPVAPPVVFRVPSAPPLPRAVVPSAPPAPAPVVALPSAPAQPELKQDQEDLIRIFETHLTQPRKAMGGLYTYYLPVTAHRLLDLWLQRNRTFGDLQDIRKFAMAQRRTYTDRTGPQYKAWTEIIDKIKSAIRSNIAD